nr:hypothetical protein [Meridianimarinicoccus roseus]
MAQDFFVRIQCLEHPPQDVGRAMLTTLDTTPIFRFSASVVCRPKIGKIRIYVMTATP